jgi:hypothetical protein
LRHVFGAGPPFSLSGRVPPPIGQAANQKPLLMEESSGGAFASEEDAPSWVTALRDGIDQIPMSKGARNDFRAGRLWILRRVSPARHTPDDGLGALSPRWGRFVGAVAGYPGGLRFRARNSRLIVSEAPSATNAVHFGGHRGGLPNLGAAECAPDAPQRCLDGF